MISIPLLQGIRFDCCNCRPHGRDSSTRTLAELRVSVRSQGCRPSKCSMRKHSIHIGRNQNNYFLVSRPERSALAEAERTRNELNALGLKNQKLIVNGIFEACAMDDSIAVALEQRGREAIGDMPSGLKSLAGIDVPLVVQSLIGVSALRHLGETV